MGWFWYVDVSKESGGKKSCISGLCQNGRLALARFNPAWTEPSDTHQTPQAAPTYQNTKIPPRYTKTLPQTHQDTPGQHQTPPNTTTHFQTFQTVIWCSSICGVEPGRSRPTIFAKLSFFRDIKLPKLPFFSLPKLIELMLPKLVEDGEEQEFLWKRAAAIMGWVKNQIFQSSDSNSWINLHLSSQGAAVLLGGQWIISNQLEVSATSV